MRVVQLKFNKKANGDWYYDFPGHVFFYGRLKMDRGSDLLCEYVAEKEGHPDYAIIDATISDNLIAERAPDISLTLSFPQKDDDGAIYYCKTIDGTPPVVVRDGQRKEISEVCLISLLFHNCNYLLPGEPYIEAGDGKRFYITHQSQPHRINIYIKH